MVLLSLSFDSLHGILRRLYDEMTELCQPMMTLAMAIAALGALFYIAYRVWQSLSRAEPASSTPRTRNWRRRSPTWAGTGRTMR